MKGTLTISEADLNAIVAQRVAEILTDERVAEIASKHINLRIGRLTLAEAAPRLGCKNDRQVKDKCRALGITIYKDLGQKAPYILLADIEANQSKRRVMVPLEASRGGTRIGHMESHAA
ncbi:MAG: hypothetical protein P4L99_27940 [Chthoniobacter sp.]|nr:hypothetical protein [Chthoniobacter sp.]